MTIQQKVKQRDEFIIIKRYFETGAIDLIDATRSIIDKFQKGTFCSAEAEEAIRLLAKIKRK